MPTFPAFYVFSRELRNKKQPPVKGVSDVESVGGMCRRLGIPDRPPSEGGLQSELDLVLFEKTADKGI